MPSPSAARRTHLVVGPSEKKNHPETASTTRERRAEGPRRSMHRRRIRPCLQTWRGDRRGRRSSRRNRHRRLLRLDAPASIWPVSLAVGAPPRPEPPRPSKRRPGPHRRRRSPAQIRPRRSPGNGAALEASAAALEASAAGLGKKAAQATPSRPPPSKRGERRLAWRGAPSWRACRDGVDPASRRARALELCPPRLQPPAVLEFAGGLANRRRIDLAEEAGWGRKESKRA
ncbi:unnamed protein product [Urochloa humidicola]